MPLLYGEGARAFIRLQEEVMKTGNDPTIFAWPSSAIEPGTEYCQLEITCYRVRA
jgi:hypothetical protein